jgi:hypothetical protein
MALIDSEGFGFSAALADYVTYGALLSQSGDTGRTISTGIVTSGGPLGDNYLCLATYGGGNTSVAVRALPSAPSSFFFGARVQFNVTASTRIIEFRDAAGTAQFNLTLNPSGNTLTIQRGSTVLGTLASCGLSAVAWHYLEVGAVVNGTTGSVVVRLDGVTILSVSGVNNQGASGSLVGRVAIGQLDNQTGSSNAYFAHYYFCDASGSSPWNTFLGDVRVQTLLPTSNGTVQFTPNGLTNNYQNAAKVPPLPGTDFNSDSTVGQQDIFNCGTLASGLTSVFGVNVKTLLAKSDAGARSGATVLKSSSTTVTGTSTALSLSTLQQSTLYQTDPNTSAQWTRTAVNAAQPGYTVSA